MMKGKKKRLFFFFFFSSAIFCFAQTISRFPPIQSCHPELNEKASGTFRLPSLEIIFLLLPFFDFFSSCPLHPSNVFIERVHRVP